MPQNSKIAIRNLRISTAINRFSIWIEISWQNENFRRNTRPTLYPTSWKQPSQDYVALIPAFFSNLVYFELLVDRNQLKVLHRSKCPSWPLAQGRSFVFSLLDFRFFIFTAGAWFDHKLCCAKTVFSLHTIRKTW